jgi:hypothetical protein
MKNYNNYNELLAHGMPEIPAPYSLIFKPKKKATAASAYGYGQGEKFTDVIACTIRYMLFGFIPIPVQWVFMTREERANRYSDDIDFLLSKGYLTEEQFASKEWYPAHLAALGRFAYREHIEKKVRQKELKKRLKLEEKERKARAATTPTENFDHVRDFFKKGMP